MVKGQSCKLKKKKELVKETMKKVVSTIYSNRGKMPKLDRFSTWHLGRTEHYEKLLYSPTELNFELQRQLN